MEVDTEDRNNGVLRRRSVGGEWMSELVGIKIDPLRTNATTAVLQPSKNAWLMSIAHFLTNHPSESPSLLKVACLEWLASGTVTNPPQDVTPGK